ncbi:cupin [Candidatus Persebacteraceae bacterium Df01]|jgi:hypothetical protein|uniref:Cupin n=1 Tax=Candidatus Doriopsillibacter californiensis TaxID=2970740 RepID=A0ABT7QKJ4_9GAMM|nr:cupin [Candidatus Persebacteraceae bacterium Df01]
MSTKGNAIGTILIENTRTRVTEWRFPEQGYRTGIHIHEHDYCVIPMFTGTLEIQHPDGTIKRSELSKGVPYFRKKGVHHDVISVNDFDCCFIEVEYL